MATPVRVGPEFLVNTTTADDQLLPISTGLLNGNFVIGWFTQSIPGTPVPAPVQFQFQLFDPSGSAIGAEITVEAPQIPVPNRTRTGLSTLEDGRFVLAWTDARQIVDTDGSAIYAQIFEADGTTSTSDFLVNTSTTSVQSNAKVEAMAGGGFVVGWTDGSYVDFATTTAPEITARIYDAAGAAVSGEFMVNTTAPLLQDNVRIAQLTNGNLVFTWVDSSATGGDTSGSAIRAQIFEANGTPVGGEFLVNTSTFQSQRYPALAALAGGKFVITWDNFGGLGDGQPSAVLAQIFNADGSKSGSEFRINTSTIGSQEFSEIVALSDGRFLVTWMDFSRGSDDPSLWAIRAQLFNANGTKSGEEFLVNTTTEGDQWLPTISELADGRVVIAWTDDSQSGRDVSGSAIRAQIFDPREDGIDPFLIVGTDGPDTLSGSESDDTIDALDGDDVLRGLEGDDILNAGDGTDTINGGPGNDTITGGETASDRRDTIFGGDGNDSIDAGHGNDLVYGQDGDDVIAGGFGADELFGQNGDDVITGSAFSDLVFGGDGDDFVNGGFGFDRINGGTGADKFFHAAADGHGSDWLQDYSAGEGDVLVFGGSGASASDFVVRFAHTATPAGERSGDDDVQEAFVNFRGQTLWALVDGGGQEEINLQIGADTFDLLA